MPVAVLMYHGVERSAHPGDGLRYTVTLSELREQLALLDRRDVIDAAELGAGERREGVALTFDDGEASVLSLAAPILVERKLPAALFMTTGLLGKSGYLDVPGLRELAALGFTIGAHGVTHRFLSTLMSKELDDELVGARKRLEDVLGQRVTGLALPGGRGGPRVTERARAAGYETIYTSMPGWNGSRMDRFAIRRTAIRRGMDAGLVRRLVRCDPIAHARDVAKMASRNLVRNVVGHERYHQFSKKILSAIHKL